MPPLFAPIPASGRILVQSRTVNAGIYRYDDLDRRFVAERVEQFSNQVARRLAGELTEDEFKPLRLMNGLYLQLHAYMLRIAVPYGVLTTTQFRKLSEIGRKYDKGYGHFTTRQNLQFNWIRLEDTPAILGELAEVDMHALQTSGNCVRNVTTDQFVGAAADEIVDGRVYAEILRQWTIAHPEFTYLPRKFKIAIMGSDSDRAAIRTHDVGVIAKRNEAGEIGFTFYVGGGLGRSPFVGKLVREWVPEQDFAAYLEAILRVYNQYGRRDNIYKARIKILVHQLGIEKFTAEVEEEFDRLPRPKFTLAPEIVEGIRARFASPPLETLPADSASFESRKAENAEFARWATVNLAAAQDARLRHRLRLAEACGRHSRRYHVGADGHAGRSGRPLQLRRDPRDPRAEPRPGACPQGRPVRPVAAA